MQQDAVSRVREMQSRANLAAQETPPGRFVPPPGYISPNYRNWSTNPSIQRRNGRRQQQTSAPTPAAQNPPPPPQNPPPPPQNPAPPPNPDPPAQKAAPVLPPEEAANGESTTLIQDILGAIGLDDDRLLIIGLLFILINAKADTTLILALIYLLI